MRRPWTLLALMAIATSASRPVSAVAQDQPLTQFDYEVEEAALAELARRIGCEQASRLLAYPKKDLRGLIKGLLVSPAPYSYLRENLFADTLTEQRCRGMAVPTEGDKPYQAGVDEWLSLLQEHGYGLTIVMVGGFGSHLTDDGALFDSRKLWSSLGRPVEQLRIIRHECTPNSYSEDKHCSSQLRDRFAHWEEQLPPGVEHRYLVFGYSKGGPTTLAAMAQSQEFRDKTLALVTLGSPFGGGFVVHLVLPILDEILRRNRELAGNQQMLLELLMQLGAGDLSLADLPARQKKILEMIEGDGWAVIQGGFASLRPKVKRRYLQDAAKNWDLSRSIEDPILGLRRTHVFHVAGVADISRFQPLPTWTLGPDLAWVPKPGNLEELAQLATLRYLREYPLSDTCVALEHAVIPRSLRPPGVETELLALLKLDHMKMGLNENKGVPAVALVDALMAATLQRLKAIHPQLTHRETSR